MQCCHQEHLAVVFNIWHNSVSNSVLHSAGSKSLTFGQGNLPAIAEADELFEIKLFAWLRLQLQLPCLAVASPLFELPPYKQHQTSVSEQMQHEPVRNLLSHIHGER